MDYRITPRKYPYILRVYMDDATHAKLAELSARARLAKSALMLLAIRALTEMDAATLLKYLRRYAPKANHRRQSKTTH